MVQTNMSLSASTRARLDELAEQSEMSLTGYVEQLIEQAWLAEFKFGFNRACTQLGITDEREPFAAYWTGKRNSPDECHVLDVWRVIYRCFEDSADFADWKATQEDARA